MTDTKVLNFLPKALLPQGSSRVIMETMTVDVPELRTKLRELREDFAELHKTLLESERIVYERQRGEQLTNGEYFQLLLTDAQFRWIHPLSQLLTRIDETLESNEFIGVQVFGALLGEVRLLLKGKEAHAGFEARYRDTMQRDPAVVVAHGRVSQVIRRYASDLH